MREISVIESNFAPGETNTFIFDSAATLEFLSSTDGDEMVIRGRLIRQEKMKTC